MDWWAWAIYADMQLQLHILLLILIYGFYLSSIYGLFFLEAVIFRVHFEREIRFVVSTSFGKTFLVGTLNVLASTLKVLVSTLKCRENVPPGRERKWPKC